MWLIVEVLGHLSVVCLVMHPIVRPRRSPAPWQLTCLLQTPGGFQLLSIFIYTARLFKNIYKRKVSVTVSLPLKEDKRGTEAIVFSYKILKEKDVLKNRSLNI